MHVRKATYEDLPELMTIFASARQIMRDSGNLHQWNDSYPSETIVRKDISEGTCMVLCDGEEDVIIATMAFIPGPDPTYAKIYTDGTMTEETTWPDENPYHVIHRIAAARPGRNAARILLDWAFHELSTSCSIYPSTIRIDTHSDNVIMHHLLGKYGFTRCGIIRLADGAPRTAYLMNKKIKEE